ncbi:MAG: DUF5652 family protein [Candidatus Parcubacteria bacterium]|nr:DUF5652 family protein [Candidatus Parcubacteria bacterium]
MEQFIMDNLWLIYLILIWSLIWKGLALWKSARQGQKIWYVVLLLANTLGILEILYIYVFSKLKKSQS